MNLQPIGSPTQHLLRKVTTIALLLLGAFLLVILITTHLVFAAPTIPQSATYSIVTDNRRQTTILVSGAGATVTLADIQSAVAMTDPTYLTNPANGIWYLDVNLVIGKEVTLNLAPSYGVNELQLRSGSNRLLSQAERIADANAPDAPAAIAYSTFVYLKAESGTINIDNVKIYSWDNPSEQVDEDESNGRAYILAKYASTLNIRNSDIGYLGSKDGESYGISWRDVGETDDGFVTRVTGEVINSKIHHNYYGIYTYQAQNMTFRGNEFYSNIRYGFDPHDYSHHFTVEENLAYNNGAHGFIISRGCNNFIFRNNRSYDNADPGSNLAHGFMLDPGGADIDKPQVSSSNNLLENNEAYNNEGYGIRILGSSDNTLRNNHFHGNEMGISIDTDSDRNLFQNNRLEENRKYGFYIRENQGNQLLANQVNRNAGEGIEIRKAVDLLIEENTISANGSHGVDMSDSAKNNLLVRNRIENNGGYGISVSGSTSTKNRWSQNQISDNQAGGINDRVGKLAAPQLTSATATQLRGRAKAGATVEIFADNAASGQGARYVGKTTADGSGEFVYTVSGSWGGEYLTATALDQDGNASAFSAPIAVSGVAEPTVTAPATATATPTPSSTATIPSPPTGTSTPRPTITVLPTNTPTPTVTPAATETATATGTIVPTLTATGTAVSTATVSPTQAGTATPTAVSTPGGAGFIEEIYLPFVVR